VRGREEGEIRGVGAGASQAARKGKGKKYGLRSLTSVPRLSKKGARHDSLLRLCLRRSDYREGTKAGHGAHREEVAHLQLRIGPPERRKRERRDERGKEEMGVKGALSTNIHCFQFIQSAWQYPGVCCSGGQIVVNNTSKQQAHCQGPDMSKHTHAGFKAATVGGLYPQAPPEAILFSDTRWFVRPSPESTVR
jgi:hypothetical protein